MHQNATWYGGTPPPRRLCVIWDPVLPRKKRAEPPPQFSAHFYCGQTAGWIKMPRGMEVGLSPGNFVLDRDPAPSQNGGGAPQFLAHLYCGQTAVWIKMPLGTEVGLGPDDILLDGEPVLLAKKGAGAEPLPNFQLMSIVAKRLDGSRWQLARRWALVQSTLCSMGTQLPSTKRGQRLPQFSAHCYCGQTARCTKMPLRMEVGLIPGDFVLDGDQAPSPKGAEPPNFWPTSIVAKRLHGSRCHCHLVRK